MQAGCRGGDSRGAGVERALAGDGGLPAGGVEGELHFVEPVIGVHLLHQRPDLGVLCGGMPSQLCLPTKYIAARWLDVATVSGFYLRPVTLVQIGEIVDKLIELKLLIAVCVVLFENLMDLPPIRHIRMPQIKRVFDLRAIDFVLIATARCLQQQRYLFFGRSHGTCRPMSRFTIDLNAFFQLLGIQVPRFVIVVVLNERPNFSKAGLLLLERESVVTVILYS